MRFLTATLLVMGLAGIPIGCVIERCQVMAAPHDCCPRTQAVTACPLDILASAKTASRQHSAPAMAAVAVIAPLVQIGLISANGPRSAVADQRNLHLRNRVLLV